MVNTDMLSSSFLSVMQASSPDQFRDEIVRFAGELGFQYVSAMTVVDHALNQSEFIDVNNMPREFAESAGCELSSCRRDPVMQHCKSGTLPIIWDRKTYIAQGAADLWEEQAEFGYRTGIAMAMHFPEGRHFMLGVDRDVPLPERSRDLTRIVADLQLFAVHAQDAAMRLFVQPALHPERPSLTRRELEALSWTMEGKTAWEVGTILGISERTVVLHLQNSMRKLNCVNKHQAVLKALRLGLIR